MREIETQQLKDAVERVHNCSARVIQSVPVIEELRRATVWEGVVHIFELFGHPSAKKAYSWSSPIEGRNQRRFFAVLHQPPITSPLDAVWSAIASEHRATLLHEMDTSILHLTPMYSRERANGADPPGYLR
jgi:hypothetical protein